MLTLAGSQDNLEDALLNEIFQQGNIEIEQNGDAQKFDISVKDEVAQNEWQAVLHEDSGEYYYWNLQTGETTWKKPTSPEKIVVGRSDDLIPLERKSTLVVETLQNEDTLNKHDDEHDTQLADTSCPIKDSEIISSEGGFLSESNMKIVTEIIPDSQVALQEPAFVTPQKNLKEVGNSDDGFLPNSDADTGNTNGCKVYNGSSQRVTVVVENDVRDDGFLQDIQREPLTQEAERKCVGVNAIDSSLVSDPVASAQMREETARSMLEEKGEALQQRLRNLAG